MSEWCKKGGSLLGGSVLCQRRWAGLVTWRSASAAGREARRGGLRRSRRGRRHHIGVGRVRCGTAWCWTSGGRGRSRGQPTGVVTGRVRSGGFRWCEPPVFQRVRLPVSVGAWLQLKGAFAGLGNRRSWSMLRSRRSPGCGSLGSGRDTEQHIDHGVDVRCCVVASPSAARQRLADVMLLALQSGQLFGQPPIVPYGFAPACHPAPFLAAFLP